MISRSDFQKLNRQIQLLKRAAQDLDALGDGFPAVKRNTARILSSIKMMEINVPDIVQPAESEGLATCRRTITEPHSLKLTCVIPACFKRESSHTECS